MMTVHRSKGPRFQGPKDSLLEALVANHQAGQVQVLQDGGAHGPPPVDQLDELLTGRDGPADAMLQ